MFLFSCSDVRLPHYALRLQDGFNADRTDKQWAALSVPQCTPATADCVCQSCGHVQQMAGSIWGMTEHMEPPSTSRYRQVREFFPLSHRQPVYLGD